MSEEALSQHKRMAQGETIALAKGKSVIQKYAKGGAVMPEGGVANLPAKGAPKEPVKATGEKIATMKKGGKAKMPALTVVIGVPRKAAGRGR